MRQDYRIDGIKKQKKLRTKDIFNHREYRETKQKDEGRPFVALARTKDEKEKNKKRKRDRDEKRDSKNEERRQIDFNMCSV